MPERDLALLLTVARAAGEVARRFWRQSPKTREKPGGEGPVSEADIAVNDLLRDALLAARPGYGWLSEESLDDVPARQSTRRVFVVDPIDGTRAYLAGQREFAHSLAVVEAGVPIAAVVHLPERGLTYSASASGPAQLNGATMPAPAAVRAASAVVLASAAAQSPEHWQQGATPGFRRAFCPSLAWRFCLVAEGRFDAALSLRPAWEWDIAAGALIAARAGLRVSDRRGAPLRFNRTVPQADGLLVAAPGLHTELRGALADQAASGECAP